MYRFLIIAFPSIFYDKTVKALYSLKRNVLSLNPSLYTSLHIFFFYHTIKLILLCGSEVFRTFVRFAFVWFCRFPLPLGVWEGLRFVIVAFPGLFSYPFLVMFFVEKN